LLRQVEGLSRAPLLGAAEQRWYASHSRILLGVVLMSARSLDFARNLCIGLSAALALFCAAQARAQDLTRLPNVVDKVAPSVVSISNDAPQDSKISLQSGAGIVLSSDGFIATAAFIVEGVMSANVTFSDGKTLIGAVVGADPRSNVAILKVQPTAILK